MKTLLVLRHGKSDWEADVDDADRPLAKRGARAARAMGGFLTSARQVPDAVVTSTARRATDTAALAAATGAWRCPLRRSDLLSSGDRSGVPQTARAEPDATTRLLLVGHEPASSEAIALLVGGGAHAAHPGRRRHRARRRALGRHRTRPRTPALPGSPRLFTARKRQASRDAAAPSLRPSTAAQRPARNHAAASRLRR